MSPLFDFTKAVTHTLWLPFYFESEQVMQRVSKLWQAWLSSQSTALITPDGCFTWAQLNTVIDRYADYLLSQGVNAGDVVTLVGKNSAQYVVCYLAAIKVGAAVALIMPQPQKQLLEKLTTLYRPQQTVYCCGVELDGITSHNNKQQLDFPSFAACFGDDLPSSEQALDRSSLTSELASIIFTSGSTGTPKAVAHTSEQHLASASGLLELFKFGESDTWLLSLPIYHVSGLAIIYRWLVAGGCLKIGEQGLEQDIQGCSHASLVATQLHRLLESKQSLSLTHVLLGGSHIPQGLASQASANGIETWIGYGMTEAASTVTAKRVNDNQSAGQVLPNRILKVEQQRIYIGGETLASGYYYQGAITPIKDSEGWFDSKDLGNCKNEELYIIGRADNQFISGGENIHCEEIEAVLSQLQEVSQAIVIPVPDLEYGHRPVAVLQSELLLSQEYIESHLATRLVKFKWPIAYFSLPQTLLGNGIKISRKQVKEWVLTQLSRT